jgi:hypothetical protein
MYAMQLLWLLQQAPLNGITLGQRKTDSNNGLILIREQTTHKLFVKYLFGDWSDEIIINNKFDPINQFIPLSVIPLSGAKLYYHLVMLKDKPKS